MALGEGFLGAFALGQMAVEALRELGAALAVHRPKARHHLVRAAGEELPCQAERSLQVGERPAGALAGGEVHQAGARKAQALELLGFEGAVLPGAGGEQQARKLRASGVGPGVASEVDHLRPTRELPERRLGGRLSQQHAAAPEAVGHLLRFLLGLRQARDAGERGRVEGGITQRQERAFGRHPRRLSAERQPHAGGQAQGRALDQEAAVLPGKRRPGERGQRAIRHQDQARHPLLRQGRGQELGVEPPAQGLPRLGLVAVLNQAGETPQGRLRRAGQVERLPAAGRAAQHQELRRQVVEEQQHFSGCQRAEVQRLPFPGRQHLLHAPAAAAPQKREQGCGGLAFGFGELGQLVEHPASLLEEEPAVLRMLELRAAGFEIRQGGFEVRAGPGVVLELAPKAGPLGEHAGPPQHLFSRFQELESPARRGQGGRGLFPRQEAGLGQGELAFRVAAGGVVPLLGEPGSNFVGIAGVGLEAAEYSRKDPAYQARRGILGYEQSASLESLQRLETNLQDMQLSTREFIGGSDEFAVNIGIVKDTRALVGLIASPARNIRR